MLIGFVPLILDSFLAWYNKDGDGNWSWQSTFFHQPLQNMEEKTEDEEAIEM